MIDNWMIMGKAALEIGNQNEAYNYFTKILENDPSNWRAIFERGKVALRQPYSRFPEFKQSIKTALSIISEIDMSESKLADIKNEIALEVFNSRHLKKKWMI